MKEGGVQHDSDSFSDEEKPKNRGWFFDYAPPPPLGQCSDDEEKFLKPIEASSQDNKNEVSSKDDTGPKAADWRFGPAQIWYDMLEVPECGEGFNYGFKLKDSKDEDSDEPPEGDPFPDDAFLMVTQLHWEDDVVWDGNDIKHKVQNSVS